MIWIVLAVLLGPSALLIAIGWIRPVQDFVRHLEIQQPPRWIRHVMGIRWSPVKAVLFAWIYGPYLAFFTPFIHVRALICRHRFDKTYGSERDGSPSFYCSKCFRWKDHKGFCE